jgi:hypothetical protein
VATDYPSVKVKRENNRKAQEAFRRRRQAQEESDRQRLKTYEDALTEMGSAFSMLVDELS